MSDRRTITRDWLKALGALVAGNVPTAELKAKYDAYTPLLIEEFHEATFTRSSLAEIAMRTEFFPAFAKLCDLLRAWQKDHPPPPTASTLALAGPDGVTLEGMDAAWFNFWHSRIGDARAKQADLQERGRLGADRAQWPVAMLASLVRTQSPTAWRVIRNAAGRPLPEDQGAPSDEARAAVGATLAAIRPTTGTRGSRPLDQPQQRPAVRAVPVSPEVLAAARQAAGIKVTVP